jgi:hypothetical protein
MVGGVYLDEFAKIDGQWYLRRRIVEQHWVVPETTVSIWKA